MARYHFKHLRCTLTVEPSDRQDRDGRILWDVTLGHRDRAWLEFTVGEPLCRTDEYGPVEAEIAASALSFLSEPSAWDDESERAVSEDMGEQLHMAAMDRRDSLGRVMRRHAGY